MQLIRLFRNEIKALIRIKGSVQSTRIFKRKRPNIKNYIFHGSKMNGIYKGLNIKVTKI